MKRRILIWWKSLAKVSAIKLAIALAVLTEVLSVLACAFGNFGPCNVGWIFEINLPSVFLAEEISEHVNNTLGAYLYIPIVILGGIATLVIIFWAAISLWRKLCRKSTDQR